MEATNVAANAAANAAQPAAEPAAGASAAVVGRELRGRKRTSHRSLVLPALNTLMTPTNLRHLQSRVRSLGVGRSSEPVGVRVRDGVRVRGG